MRRYVAVRAADHLVCTRASEFRSHFIPIEQDAYNKRLADAKAAANAAAVAKAAQRGVRAKQGKKPLEVPALKGLRSPDAIHLATASLYSECMEFHTFDGDGKTKSTALRLLDLNGAIPGFKIPIRRPYKPDSEPVDLFDGLL